MEIYTLEELQVHRANVIAQVGRARAELNNLVPDPLEAFYALKFERIGFHPLNGNELNLIEQLNQTFHELASFAAASYLIEHFPQCEGLRLAQPFAQGINIRSIVPDLIAAEVFTAVNPGNNRKLIRDAERVDETQAEHRFVFFYSPEDAPALIERVHRDYGDVQIRPLTWDEMVGQE